MLTEKNKENLKHQDRAFETYQQTLQSYKFQRRRKYKAPSNHPWRQYKATTKT